MRLALALAWRNLWRHPRRSVLTAGAIAFATAVLVFMLSWQLGNYEVMIDTAVRLRTGHLQVQAAGYHEQRDIWRVVPDPAEVERRVSGVPGVAAVTTRASAFALAASAERSYGSLVIGVEEREEAVSRLPRLVRRGTYLAGGHRAEAVLGAALATNLRVGVGDEVTLLGQGADGSMAATVVTVSGVLESGESAFDRAAVLLSLPFFQDVYSMGGAVHEVAVLADSLAAVPAIERAAREALDGDVGTRLEVLDWQRLQPGVAQAIRVDLASGLVFYAILVVLVAFSILNTFVMTVFERTRELGVMLAIGCGPSRLVALLGLEAVMMTLLGCSVGLAAGVAVTSYFHSHGIVIEAAIELARLYGLPERMHPRLTWSSAGIGVGLVLAASLLTAAVPTLAAGRLRAVRAMAGGSR